MVTASEIVADLRSLGIAEGANLVVHSSLSSMGPVAGGAEAVIAALLEVIGGEGTLAMPTFTFPPDSVFDPRTTRSTVGIIAKTFRKRNGVLRSLHPTHSVAAFGPLARHIINGHPTATALGTGSPLHRLALSGGYVLLLGVRHTSNAMIHVGEAVARAPYLDLPYSEDFNVSIPVRTPDGTVITVPPKENPGCSINFNAVECPLRERGLAEYGTIGKAGCQLVLATDVIEIVGRMLESDSTALLCDIEWCPFCPRARQLLKKQAHHER
jgi:aminoglycoside 3-N-acetyltransferase